jgi:hypothetical protein
MKRKKWKEKENNYVERKMWIEGINEYTIIEGKQKKSIEKDAYQSLR